MPASRRRVLSLTAALVSLQATAVVLASRAAAEPTPTPSTSGSPSPGASPGGDSRCELLSGPVRDRCENGESGGGTQSGGLDPTSAADPLGALGRACAEAASWTVDTLSKAVKSTATVDFTNPTFISQYAIVFAATTVLTLLLWLLAVAKRAIRGVPFTTAVSEAIGFLWLTVLASAFTPLVLYTLVSATDSVTEVITGGTDDQTEQFFGNFSAALKQGNGIGGGPIMQIVVSLVTIVAAGVLYLELFIRAIVLYVGALLGVVVYSGLVDKNMWGNVRRWAGIMIAIILVKPVIAIVLGLAGALTNSADNDAISSIVSGLAIIILAIVASAMIYRFVPGFGDEIIASRNNRLQGGVENRAAAVISSPAALVSQGIKTHSARGNPGEGSAGGGGSTAPRPANPVGGGMAAHSSRPAGTASGGAGPAPGAAAPPPRNPGPATSTPHSNRNTTGGAGR
ncbi:hypothetical protein [Streptomyces clavuligerus]|uniref:Integral membrane protein n=2 Tax=Streptomyces clavuligerus TaxID=1901 RepID=E2PXY5_STRCL|nr:hypothetical protein [Streptomyces clavuligerus]ANW19050.1 hypothetical protein BB341_12815 [Streptomyces clavuligerus]AXU13632.1 hypothetical protein D1794_13285 [Streptomyces clavuligerus]EFG08225.1 Integral membrane protein [Streptomyces clavuligerus]MBY6303597.1 hypothetical protein [Streptomyces clavuligerus]QCS06417.1 hypothetical protein CRV15_12720 [Streptomyces clavuligerus]